MGYFGIKNQCFRFFILTPAPPPFSEMNLTPPFPSAATKACLMRHFPIPAVVDTKKYLRSNFLRFTHDPSEVSPHLVFVVAIACFGGECEIRLETVAEILRRAFVFEATDLLANSVARMLSGPASHMVSGLPCNFVPVPYLKLERRD